MLTYTELQNDRRKFLSLTGLTLREFQQLLPAFEQSYERLYREDQTLAGQPRQRFPGGGRKGALHTPEQKLLFLSVYLKTYPLQTLLGELFELSQPRVNYWLHRLLPLLHEALDALGVLPERDGRHFAQSQAGRGEDPHGERTSDACRITTCAGHGSPDRYKHSLTQAPGRMEDAGQGAVEVGGSVAGGPRPPQAV